jgi:hypothetical protein
MWRSFFFTYLLTLTHHHQDDHPVTFLVLHGQPDALASQPIGITWLS